MSEQKSLVDRALDLVVYVPVGLTADRGEELSKLAEKGRRRVGPQVAMAKVVGRLALGQVQREVERQVVEAAARLRLLLGPAPARPQPGPEGELGEGVVSVKSQPAGPPPGPSGAPGGPTAAGPPAGAAARAPGRSRGRRAPRPARSSPTPPSPGGKEPPGLPELPIHGYDALSAPQVVKRLGGLSASELEAVWGYETATRGRRTILSRIAQLRSGTGG
jgi:hypothetical protein